MPSLARRVALVLGEILYRTVPSLATVYGIWRQDGNQNDLLWLCMSVRPSGATAMICAACTYWVPVLAAAGAVQLQTFVESGQRFSAIHEDACTLIRINEHVITAAQVRPIATAGVHLCISPFVGDLRPVSTSEFKAESHVSAPLRASRYVSGLLADDKSSDWRQGPIARSPALPDPTPIWHCPSGEKPA